jgi:ribosomal protein S18 acetylase RimI-like enzyme
MDSGAGEAAGRVRCTIRPVAASDRDWVREVTIAEWGSEIVVVHGDVLRPGELPGFVAWIDGERAGLLTYEVRDGALEIVTLNSWREGSGVGTALCAAAEAEARRAGCRRLWLITTNDNLEALGFDQRRGFALVAVHREAVTRSRRIKPEIPRIGARGIPIRDEIELEKPLG